LATTNDNLMIKWEK